MKRQVTILIVFIIVKNYSYYVYDKNNLIFKLLESVLYIYILLDLLVYSKKNENVNCIIPVCLLTLSTILNIVRTFSHVDVLIPIGFVIVLCGSFWLGIILLGTHDLKLFGISYIIIPLLMLLLIYVSILYEVKLFKIVSHLLELVPYLILIWTYHHSNKSFNNPRTLVP